MNKIILFELNEVPWRILNDYIEKHPDSALATVNASAKRFETISEDKELSPWVTWPSVHRGVPDRDHTISNFGQHLNEIDAAYPPLWEIISKHANSVGVFGSLHTHPLPDDLTHCAFHIPDIFAAGQECFPSSVEPYQQWNLRMSRNSARNVSTKLPFQETLKFLGSLPNLGIRPQTAVEIGRHILDERKTRWKVTRRRTQQVLIAFDVFMKQLQNSRPAFTTFFTNHVASTMHRYWAARFPGDYDEFGYSDEWQTTHRHEIEWTLSKFDEMLKRLVEFTSKNTEFQIWIVSSMGQAATQAKNAALTQLYIDDFDKFMSFFNISSEQYIRKPAMAPRIIVKFNSNSTASRFQSLSKNIRFSNVRNDSLAPGENTHLQIKNLGHNVFMIRVPVIQNHNDNTIAVNDSEMEMQKLGIRDVNITDLSGQTAYHIPQGSVMIYSPKQQCRTTPIETISALEIAPMVLNNYNIPAPSYMAKTTVGTVFP